MQTSSISGLLSRFDDILIDQARADCRRRKVVSIAWSDEDTITAKLSASKGIYTSTVHLKADRASVCCVECTCEFGREGMGCRHSASVLLTYLENPSSIAPYVGSNDSSEAAFSNLVGDKNSRAFGSGKTLPADFQDFMATMFELNAPDSAKAAKIEEKTRPVPPESLKLDDGLKTGLKLFRQ